MICLFFLFLLWTRVQYGLFQVFQRRHDKNLKNGDEVDLVHRLQENQLRHDRYRRSYSSYSAAVTPRNALSRTTSEDRGQSGQSDMCPLSLF